MSSTSSDPRPRTRFNAQVLILLGLYLFGGGSDGGAPLSERVQSVIADEARAAEAVGHAQEIERILSATVNDAFALRTQVLAGLRQVPRDGARLRAGFQQALDQAAASEWEVIELRFKLKAAMTREEWAQLFEGHRENGVGFGEASSD